jgi:hypothetical protein
VAARTQSSGRFVVECQPVEPIKKGSTFRPRRTDRTLATIIDPEGNPMGLADHAPPP